MLWPGIPEFRRCPRKRRKPTGRSWEQAPPAGGAQEPDRLAEGEVAVVLLGEVERILDRPVGGEQGGRIGERPLEEQAARAARPDGPVRPVAEARAGVGGSVRDADTLTPLSGPVKPGARVLVAARRV